MILNGEWFELFNSRLPAALTLMALQLVTMETIHTKLLLTAVYSLHRALTWYWVEMETSTIMVAMTLIMYIPILL